MKRLEEYQELLREAADALDKKATARGFLSQDLETLAVLLEVDNRDAQKLAADLAAAQQEIARLRAAFEPDRTGPAFYDWIADRLVHQYGEDPNVDFVLTLRRRAALGREALK